MYRPTLSVLTQSKTAILTDNWSTGEESIYSSEVYTVGLVFCLVFY